MACAAEKDDQLANFTERNIAGYRPTYYLSIFGAVPNNFRQLQPHH